MQQDHRLTGPGTVVIEPEPSTARGLVEKLAIKDR
jgi:hypothetical protein